MQKLKRRLQRLGGKTINQLAERSAQWADRCLYKPHVAWWNARSWVKPFEKYLDGDRILDRRFSLVQWAHSVADLPGATAECGVYTGVGSALICKALEGTYRDGQKHLGFDSFAGLSQPVEVDLRSLAGNVSYALWEKMRRPWRKGHLTCPLENAQRQLQEFSFCELIPGWIPDTFSNLAEHSYRFVHIDVDLYQPTWDSLAYFHQRMTPGGVIFFDDYGHMTCPGSRLATDEFFRDKLEAIVELTTGQAVVVKR